MALICHFQSKVAAHNHVDVVILQFDSDVT